MPSGMAAWGHWHTLEEAERKRSKVCKMAQRATGKSKGRRN
ncbi:hypothetical protein PRABACTJOHN_03293 [Parabacteroides johnsonii DSM 18315]|uniref:Uncharacterized protein n=1 Tax=Parabacteroides johnsonii DSM 18315 TaxID=537006 RepID=B7BE18_9BACT|nr:hypothetical protein PRABACTJOHN_03293 [Parabacteroides johnsonii DSM 18315]